MRTTHVRSVVAVCLLFGGLAGCGDSETNDSSLGGETVSAVDIGQSQQAIQDSDAITTVFLGTYTRGFACPPPPENGGPCVSQGIYRTTFDPRSGVLAPPMLAALADNPSYLAVHPDGAHLYSVNEVEDFGGQNTGAVSAYAIGPHASLTLINQLPSHGADPAHISVTASGRTVLVANYTGGNVSSYRLGADGHLIDGNTLADVGPHGPHPNQADGAHAHFIVEGPKAGLVYVADLGLDRVFLYDLDARTSLLSAHAAEPFVTLAPASGPRHIALHPNHQFLYTNNELGTSASVFARDPRTGQLSAPLQTISTIPLPFAGRNDNGEIQISRDGRFIYVSNRGHDSISTFSINARTGLLTMIDNIPCGGHEPRDFKIDPSGKYLLVANHISDDMAVFRIDPGSGKPRQLGPVVPLSKPVNFAFLPHGE